MKIGLMIKKLRINKKIRSKNFYKGLLTRPAIVKFENGESDTSVERFLKMLQRLNITLEEFYYLYHEPNNVDDQLLSVAAYKQAFYNMDIAKLQIIAKASKEKYLEIGNEKYLHNKALVNLLMDSIEQKKRYQDDLDVIRQYLVECDFWGYYELTLFINTLSFYSNEFIDIAYKKTKENLTNYQHLIRYKNEISILLFNIIEKKIRSNNIKSAYFYLNELTKLDNSSIDNMYMKTMYKYFSGLLGLIEGHETRLDEINKVIEILEFLDMKHKANQCQLLLNTVIQNISKNS